MLVGKERVGICGTGTASKQSLQIVKTKVFGAAKMHPEILCIVGDAFLVFDRLDVRGRQGKMDWMEVAR